MNEIKKGDWVKAWLNESDYVVGRYTEEDEIIGHFVDNEWWPYVAKLSNEVVKEIEALGNE